MTLAHKISAKASRGAMEPFGLKPLMSPQLTGLGVQASVAGSPAGRWTQGRRFGESRIQTAGGGSQIGRRATTLVLALAVLPFIAGFPPVQWSE